MTKVNRFELIDHTDSGSGREFVKWLENNFEVRTELQDDGRTMKVFLRDIDSESDDGNDLWDEDQLQAASRKHRVGLPPIESRPPAPRREP